MAMSGNWCPFARGECKGAECRFGELVDNPDYDPDDWYDEPMIFRCKLEFRIDTGGGC